MPDVGRAVRAGYGAALLLGMMLVGSLALWIGVPLLWLWVASLVQGATANLGAGLAVAAVGVLLSIVALMGLLSWLSRRYREVRIARGLDDVGQLPLEAVLVCSAVLALGVFAVWFFGFSGAAPLPVPSG